MAKDYSELTFTDDFMFCHILVENEDLCIELVELITGRKVRKIVRMHTQKAVQISANGKGVRFDVYFEGDKNVYDIEMQTTDTGELRHRIRYYQAMIDMDHINRGGKYRDLKNSSIIFICTFDLFKKGLHKYTFHNACEEDPTVILSDGTEKIFLCAGGDADDCSPKMKAFLEYISQKRVTDDFSKRLENEVQKALKLEEWRSGYMTWNMMQDELIEKGREEGRAEGREEGRVEGREEGRVEGREEGRVEGRVEGALEKTYEIFKNMIADGISEERAMKLSGYKPA